MGNRKRRKRGIKGVVNSPFHPLIPASNYRVQSPGKLRAMNGDRTCSSAQNETAARETAVCCCFVTGLTVGMGGGEFYISS